jgi:hypothetical protein
LVVKMTTTVHELKVVNDHTCSQQPAQTGRYT